MFPKFPIPKDNEVRGFTQILLLNFIINNITRARSVDHLKFSRRIILTGNFTSANEPDGLGLLGLAVVVFIAIKSF